MDLDERAAGDPRETALRAVTIGDLEPIDGPVPLSDPDPAWPDRFEREAARIRSALGAAVLRLEHVGSTSVPGLVAKPIIDVLLVVADPTDEPAYLPALEQAGYRLRIREPQHDEHRMLRGPHRAVNVHVFGPGSGAAERLLRFRDRLRADPEARERYAAAKRELAARRWRYVQWYANAKGPVIEGLLDDA
jgi:GrpB-like predicted nucleotidyltransferase (UPF0157 family)